METPTIKFLNHSSVLVSYKETKILCDPWFHGSAFQDGWSLLSDNSHDINDLDFNYIWISHEHPDHFSIPTISSLKKKTKFIYQKTDDRKVLNYLTKKGHEVIEIEHNSKTRIGDIDLILFICDGYDSSLLFDFENKYTFLNINDARVDLNNHLETEIFPHLKDKTLDMVCFQFSYANWAGNKGDIEISNYQQKLIDDKNIHILSMLKPKQCMLMASYVYYSHEENQYWNENFHLKDVLKKLEVLSLNTQIIVPEINQEFNISTKTSDKLIKSASQSAADFWQNLHLSSKSKFKTKSISNISELENEYYNFFDRLSAKNKAINKLDAKLENLFSITIYLNDISALLKISLLKKKFEILNADCDLGQVNFDISISSETYSFLMKNNFARGTVCINSRIHFNYPTAYKFFTFFLVAYSNNIGKFYNDSQLLRNDLSNIKDTFVMKSIMKFSKESRSGFSKAMDLMSFV